ncbi:MAG: ABC transporter ATP-binding protein [Dehalococcoidia bacterium]|nr:ABC transporter ATP-binding protein [Dehalococcoidia bacterium]
MDVRLQGVRLERGGATVLSVPELDIADGRVTAVVGANGAGKSALLRLIAGVEQASMGQVLLGGEAAGRATRQHVAAALQPVERARGRVRDHLEGRRRFRWRSEDGVPARADTLATAFGIGPLMERDVRELAGGEMQRLNLVRVLSRWAPVTLIDEPFAGLDGDALAEMLVTLPAILRLWPGTAVLAMLDVRKAAALADDVVVLAGGTVVAHGTMVEVLGSPPNATAAAALGYAVVETEGGSVAVWPDALSVGTGGVTFTLSVEGAVTLPGGVEVLGRVGSSVVRVRLDAGVPAPRTGSRLVVTAAPGMVVRFAPASKSEGRADHLAVPASR